MWSGQSGTTRWWQSSASPPPTGRGDSRKRCCFSLACWPFFFYCFYHSWYCIFILQQKLVEINHGLVSTCAFLFYFMASLHVNETTISLEYNAIVATLVCAPLLDFQLHSTLELWRLSKQLEVCNCAFCSAVLLWFWAVSPVIKVVFFGLVQWPSSSSMDFWEFTGHDLYMCTVGTGVTCTCAWLFFILSLILAVGLPEFAAEA